MKKILGLLPLLLVFWSCEVEGDLTRTQAKSLDQGTAILKYSGNFSGTSGIAVIGQAKIYLEGNRYRVQLENFSISEGPDLKVYLSKGATPTEFVSLGNLTAATVYEIPKEVIVANYSHVLIHCQQYNHLYAIAPLNAN